MVSILREAIEETVLTLAVPAFAVLGETLTLRLQW